MNIIESLRKVESRIFADRNESVNLVDMYLTNSKNIDKAKLQEMLENNNTNGVIKLLNRANRKSLKEDYYTVKYYYYTDDDQIEEDGHTFDNAQDAKAFSDGIKSGLKDSLISLDWDIHDENTTRDWELIDKKTITDFDGFNTEYSLWKKIDEDYWVCIFGDSDIYGPEDGEFDAEFDTEREAREWFDNYSGFEDELNENLSLKEGKRNGKFQTVYWLVTRGRFIQGPRRSYYYGVNDDAELFWYNIEDGYKTLSSAKNAASRMMKKSNDDVEIKEYQIEFENDWSTRKAGVKEISSIEMKNPNRTYPYPKEIKKVLSDAGCSNNYYIKDDGNNLIITVVLSHIQDWLGINRDNREASNEIIKVLKDNFNLKELGKEKSRERTGWDIDYGDHHTEEEVIRYAVTYKDDGIGESLNKKNLKEELDDFTLVIKRKQDGKVFAESGYSSVDSAMKMFKHMSENGNIKPSEAKVFRTADVDKTNLKKFFDENDSLKEDWEDENHGTSDKKASMKRVEKFVDLVGGDLKSTKDGGAIITWDGGKIVAKGLQDLFSKVEKAYKKMQKSMKEDIDWSKSFATMSDEDIRKEISKMNEKSDKEYLQDYLDYFNAIYKQEDGKYIIELPYDDDIVEDSFEDLMYDVKYNLHEMSLDGSL